MPLIYRPNHPEANENGMVERALVHGEAPELALYVISDTMDGIRNHADGKMYDSKASFRRATKSAGAIEVGTETQHDRRDMVPKLRDIREDVARSFEMVRNGYRPYVENE